MKSFLHKGLILCHRYLGTALGVLIVVWFASGIVMMYTGNMPRLDPATRLERLPALDFDQVKLTALDAAKEIGLESDAGGARLLNVTGRPAYRIGGGGPVVTVFADDGELMLDASREQAKTIASRFMDLPEDRIREVGELNEPDIWTLNRGRQMPLYKFSVDDAAGTELYVSAPLGEVTLMTTRRVRTMAWLGPITHWLYFMPLRRNGELWSQVVIWGSALTSVLAVMGLVLAITQRKTRYAGLLRWHYVAGAVFGVFTFTWAFSGMMSMGPLGWPSAPGLSVARDTFTGGPLDLTLFPAGSAAAWKRLAGDRGIKEVEFVRIQDEPYYLVSWGPEAAEATESARAGESLVAAGTLAVRTELFSVESLVSRLTQAIPGVPIAEQQLLDEDDAYYYTRRGHQPRVAVMPVLRVKFQDPDETWFYIDPARSEVVATIHRQGRIHRWLYNGLHSLDFGSWYYHWTWDATLILLSIGGLVSSGAGLYMGFGRVKRSVRRFAGSSVGVPRPSVPRVEAPHSVKR